MKEASILPAIDEWLAGLFAEDQIARTCAALESTFGPDPAEEALEMATRRKLKQCDAKLAKYRQALEAGTDASADDGEPAQPRGVHDDARGEAIDVTVDHFAGIAVRRVCLRFG